MTKKERLEGKRGTAYHEVYKLVLVLGPEVVEGLAVMAAETMLSTGKGDSTELRDYLRRVRPSF